MDTTQVVKGMLDTAVLSALQGRPTYGYDLVRQLRTAGFEEIAEASVYGTLRRLHRAGFLNSEIRESDAGPARKYYSLNAAGASELTMSKKTWADIAGTMNRILEESE